MDHWKYKHQWTLCDHCYPAPGPGCMQWSMSEYLASLPASHSILCSLSDPTLLSVVKRIILQGVQTLIFLYIHTYEDEEDLVCPILLSESLFRIFLNAKRCYMNITNQKCKLIKVGAISLTFNYELGWIEPIADNPLALPGVCEW